MTGVAGIEAAPANAFSYSSAVKIAPVVSKISVSWTATGDAAYYDITGIYIVNAIDHTKLPIILRDGVNDIRFPLTITPKTASSGFEVTSNAMAKDYNIYNSTYNTTTAGLLSDVNPSGLTVGTYSFYVGENYHADLPGARNGGTLFANAAANNGANANTIILIQATPKTGTGIPTWVGSAKKYYTYDLNKSTATNNAAITGIIPDGFSIKRKTNYVVTFNLTSIGTVNPFEQLSTLHVTVQAQGWDVPTIPGIDF